MQTAAGEIDFMRICIVASSLSVMGGQAVQADDILKRLRQNGFTVGFIPLNTRLPGLLSEFQKIRYIRTLLTWPVYVSRLLVNIPRYDVLHLFSASYSSFLLAPAPAAIISKLFRKRVVLNYHSGEAVDHLRRSLPVVQKVLRFVDCVVVPSEYLNQVFGKYGIKTTVIPNVVDLEAFSFQERHVFHPRFLVTRMLEPLYNIECILNAFRLIQSRFPSAVLTILGTGSQEHYLKKLASNLELQHVDFIGRVERQTIPQYYRIHDFVLNASNIDNLPLSILEAFAAGLPVISTEAGGIPSMITDRETGMLVPLNDHASLAARAIELLENQSLAHTIAKQAYEETIKFYSWKSIRDKWLKVYGIK